MQDDVQSVIAEAAETLRGDHLPQVRVDKTLTCFRDIAGFTNPKHFYRYARACMANADYGDVVRDAVMEYAKEGKAELDKSIDDVIDGVKFAWVKVKVWAADDLGPGMVRLVPAISAVQMKMTGEADWATEDDVKQAVERPADERTSIPALRAASVVHASPVKSRRRVKRLRGVENKDLSRRSPPPNKG